MKPMLFAAALVASIPLAGNAAGQTGTFESLDTNKDGRISMPEASVDPALVENFSKADRNGDGYLDKAEFDGRPRDPRK